MTKNETPSNVAPGGDATIRLTIRLTSRLYATGSPCHPTPWAGTWAGPIGPSQLGAAEPSGAAECSILQVGEGAAHDGPAGFRQSLDEATEALMTARRRGLDRARFADLALDRLLLGSVCAQDFSAEVLAPLDALRGTKSQVAFETLVAYLTASGSVTAPRMLHLYPQSLRYRLSRLPVAVQQSLKHPRERPTIELALEARALVPPTPPPGSDELDPPEPLTDRQVRAGTVEDPEHQPVMSG